MTANAYTGRPCDVLWTTSSASLASVAHVCWTSSMSESLWAVR